MKSLADQILDLQLEVANLKRAAGRLKKLEKEYEVQKAELPKLEKKVDKEYQDILNLKKKGFIDLFLDQQEEKEARMEKEKEEYYEALVQVKNAKKALELMEFEIEILREKASKLSEKGLLLQKLKFKQKHTIELSVKKESDKAIVIKNRLKVTFHKLIRSGQNMQVHLEEILSGLVKIETWQNYDLSIPEKEKIFKEEFEKIKKVLHKQNLELLKYNFEVEKLLEFEKFIGADKKADLEKIAIECTNLKGKLALFDEQILSDLSNDSNLQNELTTLKAKIVEIQYGIDQSTKLLQISNY
jgi:hypothetical protein